jgi:hypothetical protein
MRRIVGRGLEAGFANGGRAGVRRRNGDDLVDLVDRFVNDRFEKIGGIGESVDRVDRMDRVGQMDERRGRSRGAPLDLNLDWGGKARCVRWCREVSNDRRREECPLARSG